MSEEKINVFIATPAYDGKVNIQYALSLSETILLLKMNGIEVTPKIVSSGSLLVAERNRLLEAFWQSECTHILMADSDLGWPAQAVIAMLNAKKDFVAGCYPARGDNNVFLFRPIKKANGSLINENHLLKMEYIPAGFILLSRQGLEKMRKKHKKLYYEPKTKVENSPPPGFCLFNTEVWEGEFWGEDFVFCRRAREAGLDIWVDPLIQFDHAGTIGMLVETLTTDPSQSEIKITNEK